MLRVEIYVNSTLIGSETAVRIKGDKKPESVNTYRLSDGKTITHVYGDGAAVLAEKMMRNLEKKGI